MHVSGSRSTAQLSFGDLDVAEFAAPEPSLREVTFVVVDLETTGSRAKTGPNGHHDAITEIGAVKVRGGEVIGEFATLVDPGRGIPPQIVELTGISDAMVRNAPRIAAVLPMFLEFARGTVLVAHNAGFDRPLLERRMPVYETLRWACSVVDVPWEAEGYSGAKLQYLAIQQGFFFEGHRSEIDCRALLEVLSRPLPKSGGTGLALLLQRAAESRLRLWAINSPFETKDVLRARGYRWDPAKRCWHILVAGRDAAVEEAAWLKAEVYGGRGVEIDVEVIDATVRFSPRPGTRRKRML